MSQTSEKTDIYPLVLEWLASGAVRPGERIGEESVGMRWNVSRMPAREALIRLEHEGIVTRKPGSGTYLRTLPPQEWKELYELRAAIESVVVRHLAPIITDEALAELADLARRIDYDLDSITPAEAVRLDQRFHERLAELSGLRHAQRLVKHGTFFARSFTLGATLYDRDHPFSLHGPIVEALRKRDPQAAELAIQKHLGMGNKLSSYARDAHALTED